jgi:hypothetical protein
MVGLFNMKVGLSSTSTLYEIMGVLQNMLHICYDLQKRCKHYLHKVLFLQTVVKKVYLYAIPF